MPDRPQHAARHTYLVEHYQPGVDAGELEHSARRVRTAIAEMQHEGSPVSYVSATIVPGDDYLHCVLRAPSEQLIRDAVSRAGLAYQRISSAISLPS